MEVLETSLSNSSSIRGRPHVINIRPYRNVNGDGNSQSLPRCEQREMLKGKPSLEDFPAQCKLLLDKHVDRYLDIESIVVLGEEFAGRMTAGDDAE